MKEKTRKIKKLFAFTLAEVLITLSILGVVAAITVPSLIKRNEERSTVTKVLKMYSTLQTAFETMNIEHNYDLSDIGSTSADKVVYFYKNYLSSAKICPTGGDECYLNDYPVAISGKKDYWMVKGWPSARLKDGSSITMSGISAKPRTCSTNDNGNIICNYAYFDVNGPKKGPNKIGWDVFYFNESIDGNIIAPKNTGGYECSKSNSNVHGGKGCIEYILKNRNMNYLH